MSALRLSWRRTSKITRQLTGSSGAEELQRLVNLVTVPKTSFPWHPEQIRARRQIGACASPSALRRTDPSLECGLLDG